MLDIQHDLVPERLDFIDENWTATNIIRIHGCCPKGERLRMGYRNGQCKTTTLVVDPRMTSIVAPMVLDGPIKGGWFEAYVVRALVSALRLGDVVIMDNPSSHKRSAVG